ncbi:hypothetical protein HELRODRAFT_187823 [Helobdella robusta]|uniref:FAM65 N-terminal domain-containing protein n=1 Tax=Helobdella robusta TaxID=6412 RepID=T1FPE6_HELRO|nr:hypothetical protein HELRODRAFT_187823 [Helobdella robusta]ESO12288.1 hypothetical protein HELRODRAFT_187823 [Helobdella robusta]
MFGAHSLTSLGPSDRYHSSATINSYSSAWSSPVLGQIYKNGKFGSLQSLFSSKFSTKKSSSHSLSLASPRSRGSTCSSNKEPNPSVAFQTFKEYIELVDRKFDQMTKGREAPITSMARRNLKAAERYKKRLEYQLSRVEELEENYDFHFKLMKGVVTMAQAYVCQPSTHNKKNSLYNVQCGYKECCQTMCLIESQLEMLMGSFGCTIKGLVGFARLLPNDVFEVVVRHGEQKFKTRGMIGVVDQRWNPNTFKFKARFGEHLVFKVMEVKWFGKLASLGKKSCEVYELFSSLAHKVAINFHTSGSIKLDTVLTWIPVDSVEETMNVVDLLKSSSSNLQATTEQHRVLAKHQNELFPVSPLPTPERHANPRSTPTLYDDPQSFDLASLQDNDIITHRSKNFLQHCHYLQRSRPYSMQALETQDSSEALVKRRSVAFEVVCNPLYEASMSRKSASSSLLYDSKRYQQRQRQCIQHGQQQTQHQQTQQLHTQAQPQEHSTESLHNDHHDIELNSKNTISCVETISKDYDQDGDVDDDDYDADVRRRLYRTHHCLRKLLADLDRRTDVDSCNINRCIKTFTSLMASIDHLLIEREKYDDHSLRSSNSPGSLTIENALSAFNFLDSMSEVDNKRTTSASEEPALVIRKWDRKEKQNMEATCMERVRMYDQFMNGVDPQKAIVSLEKMCQEKSGKAIIWTTKYRQRDIAVQQDVCHLDLKQNESDSGINSQRVSYEDNPATNNLPTSSQQRPLQQQHAEHQRLMSTGQNQLDIVLDIHLRKSLQILRLVDGFVRKEFWCRDVEDYVGKLSVQCDILLKILYFIENWEETELPDVLKIVPTSAFSKQFWLRCISANVLHASCHDVRHQVVFLCRQMHDLNEQPNDNSVINNNNNLSINNSNDNIITVFQFMFFFSTSQNHDIQKFIRTCLHEVYVRDMLSSGKDESDLKMAYALMKDSPIYPSCYILIISHLTSNDRLLNKIASLFIFFNSRFSKEIIRRKIEPAILLLITLRDAFVYLHTTHGILFLWEGNGPKIHQTYSILRCASNLNAKSWP